MLRRPPRSTRTDTICPYTSLFRSALLFQGLIDAGRLAHHFDVFSGRLLGSAQPFTGNGHCQRGERKTDEPGRSEEHTSELQSLMRISYAVFCLKKKSKFRHNTSEHISQLSRQ